MLWFYHPPSVGGLSKRNGVRMVKWEGLKWARLSQAQSINHELNQSKWLAACAAFDGEPVASASSPPVSGAAPAAAIDATPGPSASVAGVAAAAGADGSVTSVIDPGVHVEFNMKGALGLTWALSDPFSGPSTTMIIASVEPDSFGQEAGLQVGQQLLNMTVGGGTVVPVLSTQMDDLCGARARRSRRHALCLKLTAPNSAAPIITTQQRPKRTLATLQATGASMTAGLYSDTDWLTTSCINGVAAAALPTDHPDVFVSDPTMLINTLKEYRSPGSVAHQCAHFRFSGPRTIDYMLDPVPEPSAATGRRDDNRQILRDRSERIVGSARMRRVFVDRKFDILSYNINDNHWVGVVLVPQQHLVAYWNAYQGMQFDCMHRDLRCAIRAAISKTESPHQWTWNYNLGKDKVGNGLQCDSFQCGVWLLVMYEWVAAWADMGGTIGLPEWFDMCKEHHGLVKNGLVDHLSCSSFVAAQRQRFRNAGFERDRLPAVVASAQQRLASGQRLAHSVATETTTGTTSAATSSPRSTSPSPVAPERESRSRSRSRSPSPPSTSRTRSPSPSESTSRRSKRSSTRNMAAVLTAALGTLVTCIKKVTGTIRALAPELRGFPKVSTPTGGTRVETYGVIGQDGVRFLIQFAFDNSLGTIVDAGSGIGNLLAAVKMAAPSLDILGVELNETYFQWSQALFRRLRLPVSTLVHGNMFRYDWASLSDPVLWYCCNELFLDQAHKIVDTGFELPLGSFMICLQALPLGTRGSTTLVHAGKRLTLVRIARDVASVDWKLDFYGARRGRAQGKRDCFVYAITTGAITPPIHQSVKSQPQPATSSPAAASPAPSSPSHGSVDDNSDWSEEDDEDLLETPGSKRRRQAATTVRKPRVEATKSTRPKTGAFGELRIRTLPTDEPDSSRRYDKALDIKVTPEGQYATTYHASLVLLQAVIGVAKPTLEKWCTSGSDRVLPSLLRWASSSGYDGSASFYTVLRENKRFGGRLSAVRKKARRQRNRRRGRRSLTANGAPSAALRRAKAKEKRHGAPWTYPPAAMNVFKQFVEQDCNTSADVDWKSKDAEGWTPPLTVSKQDSKGNIHTFKISLRDASNDCRKEDEWTVELRLRRAVKHMATRCAQGVRNWFGDNAYDLLETVFKTDASAKRFRNMQLECQKKEGAQRKKYQQLCAGLKANFMQPPKVIRAGQADYLAKRGFKSSQIVLIRSCAPFDVKFVDEIVGTDKEWTPVGYVYDLKSWIAVYMLVMHAEGMLNVDLTVEDAIYDGKHLKYGLWGDGTDGAGLTKSVSQRGMLIIDVCGSIIKGAKDGGCGRSLAMNIGGWAGKEEYFMALVEYEISLLKPGELEQPWEIKFPQHKSTVIMPHVLKGLQFCIGDNKFFCALFGKMGGQAHNRFHMLQPLPVHLIDNVCLWTDCPLMGEGADTSELGNVEWRMLVLHNTMCSLIRVANTPKRRVLLRTKEATIVELRRVGVEVEGTADDHTLVDLHKQLARHLSLNPITWADIEVDGSGILPQTTISNYHDLWKTRTGQEQWPLGVARNPAAVRHAVGYCMKLFRTRVNEGRLGYPRQGDVVRYVELLFALDRATAGDKALHMDTSELSTAVVDAVNCNAVPLGGDHPDLMKLFKMPALDHGRKDLMKALFNAASTGKARPGLASNDRHAQVKAMREQMGTADENQFCGGTQWDRLVDNVDVTFGNCAPVIVMLAYLCSFSKLAQKMRPATLDTMDARPEMLCELSLGEDGNIVLTPEDLRMNYAIAIAVSHFIEMSLVMTMRLATHMPTNNLYRVCAQWYPFANTYQPACV
eukprot:COSAG01_NODE_1059_length_11895_cov_25.740929_2_plen_1799_part_00